MTHGNFFLQEKIVTFDLCFNANTKLKIFNDTWQLFLQMKTDTFYLCFNVDTKLKTFNDTWQLFPSNENC